MNNATRPRPGAALSGHSPARSALPHWPRRLAQQPSAATGTPPSVITNPPRQWGRHAPTRHLSRSRHHRHRSVVQAVLLLGNHRDPSRRDRLPVGGRTGLVERGPVLRVQRRAGQHAVSAAVGRSAGDAVPQAVEQQQRQLVRFPGAPAFDRGLLPPRGALGARRHDDGDRRPVRRQAAELAERSGAASGRQHLVHRSAVWRPRCPRAIRTRRAARPIRRVCSIRASARANAGAIGGKKRRTAERGVSLGSERAARPGDHRGPAQGSQRHLLLARLQDAVRDQHRQGAGRQPRRRHAHASTRSTCRATRWPTGASSST